MQLKSEFFEQYLSTFKKGLDVYVNICIFSIEKRAQQTECIELNMKNVFF